MPDGDGMDASQVMKELSKMVEAQQRLETHLLDQVAVVEGLIRMVGNDVQTLLPGPQSQGEQSRHTVAESSSLGGTTPAAKVTGKPSVKQKRVASDRFGSTHSPSQSQETPPVPATERSGVLDRMVLNPESRGRFCFDVVTVIALGYDAFAMPFVFAWEPPIQGVLMVCMWLTTLTWTLDMILNFFTGYYCNGLLELEWKKVARRYVRQWCVFDLLLVTTDWVNLSFEMSAKDSGGAGLGMVRILKFQRIVRLVGVLRLGRLWSRLQDLESVGNLVLSSSWPVITEVLKLFILLLFLNHSLCCVWFAIGRSGWTDTGNTWLNDFGEESVGMLYQYSTALHWTVTQMTPGSMEVHAQNSLERMFTIVWLLFGLLFGSSIVSRLSAQMVQLQTHRKAQLTMVMTLRRFLREREVNAVLASRVLGFVAKRTSIPKPLHPGDIPALALCSGPLKHELWLSMFEPHISSHPFFFTWDLVNDCLTRDLCLACTLFYRNLGDEVFAVNSPGEQAYIPVRGHLSYVLGGGDGGDSLPQDVSVHAWICEAALWMAWSTRGSLEASSNTCELVCLAATEVAKVMRKHPATEEIIGSYGAAFSRLARDLPPEALTDLEFMDHGEVVTAMPLEARSAIAQVVLNRNTRVWSAAVPFLFDYIHPSDVQSILSEVESGQCALVCGQNYKPVRVAIVVAVRVEWHSRACVLAQVAKEVAGELLPKCQLPATVCKHGETAAGAAERLLDKLRPLLPHGSDVKLRRCEQEVASQKSETYNMQARFVKKVFHMQIQELSAGGVDTITLGDFTATPAESPADSGDPHLALGLGMPRIPWSSATIGRMPINRLGPARTQETGYMYKLHNAKADDTKLYHWMPRDDYDRFSACGAAGSEELAALIDALGTSDIYADGICRC